MKIDYISVEINTHLKRNEKKICFLKISICMVSMVTKLEKYSVFIWFEAQLKMGSKRLAVTAMS